MNSEKQIIMSPKELERARKEYLKINLVNEVPSIEEFGCNQKVYTKKREGCRVSVDGNYAIVGGRKVLMEQYGEAITEIEEGSDNITDFQLDKRWRKLLNESN